MERRKSFFSDVPRISHPLPAGRLAGALGAAMLIVTLGAFLAGALPPGPQTARAQDRTGRPVRLDPREDAPSEPLSVEPGKHLLMGFLQRIADATGEVIYVAGDVPPDQTIDFVEAHRDLDAKALRGALQRSRLLMSRETLAGEEVYLVRKVPERPTRKRGGLVRPSEERPPDSEAPQPQPGAESGVPDAEERVEPTGDSGVRVFRRVDGAESGYMVIYETSSREEAEEVARTIGLILSDRKARR